MDDLIERLEKATGPDREIDARICYAVKPALHRMGTLEDWLATNASAKCLNYTWSIDDALTLVPDGWYWSTDSRGCTIVGSEYPPPQTDYCAIVRNQTAPAIALCIAALKARAAIKTGYADSETK